MSMDLDTQHFGEDGEYGTPTKGGNKLTNIKVGDLTPRHVDQQRVQVKYADALKTDVVVSGLLRKLETRFRPGFVSLGEDPSARKVEVFLTVGELTLPALSLDHLIVLLDEPAGQD